MDRLEKVALVAGYAAVVAGVALLFVPLGLVVAGVLLIMAALFGGDSK